MKRFLNNLTAIFQNRTNKTSKRIARLSVENLETRLTPSVSWAVTDINNDGFNDLRINGGSENTRVTITEQGGNEVRLSLDINGDTLFSGNGEFQNRALKANHGFSVERGVIELSMAGGLDRVVYTLSSGNLQDVTRNLNINLGEGNDEFTMFRQGSSIIAGSKLSIRIDGGDDDDTIRFVGGSSVNSTTAIVDDARLDISIDLGHGDDYALVELESSNGTSALNHGAVVNVSLAGGTGENEVWTTLEDVEEASKCSINYLGGNDDEGDWVYSGLDGVIAGASKVTLNAKLRGGNDHYDCTTTESDFNLLDKHTVVRVAVDAGTGNDSVSVNNRGVAGSYTMDIEGRFDVSLKGGAGDDILVFAFESDAAFDLAKSGRVKLRISGGDGDDRLGDYPNSPIVLSNTSSSKGRYDVVIKGDDDDDAVSLELNNPSANVRFGPRKIFLNGGRGEDRLVEAPETKVIDRFFEIFG